MSTAMIIVAVVAAVIVTGTLTISTLALIRRCELPRRFGTEYDRVTGESRSTLRAGSSVPTASHSTSANAVRSKS